jgi:putative endonuclease
MSTESGARAERQAEEFLKARGFLILERNFRTPFGEIDLVAQDGDTVVFVEVRARSSDAFGSAAETVTRPKRLKLIKTAQAFAQRRNLDAPQRFDVVALSPEGVTHIPDAFDAEGR